MMEVGRRAGLELSGVGMPGHFLVGAGPGRVLRPVPRRCPARRRRLPRAVRRDARRRALPSRVPRAGRRRGDRLADARQPRAHVRPARSVVGGVGAAAPPARARPPGRSSAARPPISSARSVGSPRPPPRSTWSRPSPTARTPGGAERDAATPPVARQLTSARCERRARLPMFPLGTVLFPYARAAAARVRAAVPRAHRALPRRRRVLRRRAHRARQRGRRWRHPLRRRDRRAHRAGRPAARRAVRARDRRHAAAPRPRLAARRSVSRRPRSSCSTSPTPRTDARPATGAVRRRSPGCCAASSGSGRSSASRCPGVEVELAADDLTRAAFEAAALAPLGPLDAQALLELDDPVARLARLERALTDEARLLEFRLVRRLKARAGPEVGLACGVEIEPDSPRPPPHRRSRLPKTGVPPAEPGADADPGPDRDRVDRSRSSRPSWRCSRTSSPGSSRVARRAARGHRPGCEVAS